MKFNNKLFGFFVSYFCGVGGFSVFITIINALIGYDEIVASLAAMTVACIPVSAVTVLLEYEGLDPFELWAKRIINALFNITCITISFFAFGVFDTAKQIALAFILGLTGNLAITIPLFIILDHRNKRKLEEINKKLKENEKNQI